MSLLSFPGQNEGEHAARLLCFCPAHLDSDQKSWTDGAVGTR